MAPRSQLNAESVFLVIARLQKDKNIKVRRPIMLICTHHGEHVAWSDKCQISVRSVVKATGCSMGSAFDKWKKAQDQLESEEGSISSSRPASGTSKLATEAIDKHEVNAGKRNDNGTHGKESGNRTKKRKRGGDDDNEEVKQGSAKGTKVTKSSSVESVSHEIFLIIVDILMLT